MIYLFPSANDVLYRKGRLTYKTNTHPTSPTSPGKKTGLDYVPVLEKDENASKVENVKGEGRDVERQWSGQGLGPGLGQGPELGQGQGPGLGLNSELTSTSQEIVTLEPWSIVAAETLLESDSAYLPEHTYFITR